MSTSRKNIYLVIFMIVIYGNAEAFPPAEPHQQQPPQQHNTRSFRNALNQQGTQSLLQSIENRLSNLDQIYSHRYSQRVDLTTDQYVRKIEMLESKLSRLESSLDAQLEKLSENLSSKNFRDDITKDQIFRKIDSLYERFNHKLSYMEEKFDMGFLKLQNRIDIGVTKIERLDDSINVRHADMESEISEGVQIIKAVKNNVNSLEEKIMNVTRFSLQNLEKIDAINYQYTNMSKSLSNIENKLVNISQEEYLNDISKKEPLYNYSNKINNMYNELWTKSNLIESNIKNSVQLMNLTRQEIQENFSDIKQNSANSNHNQNDGTLSIMLDSFTNFLQRKFTDLGTKMEDNFENIMATQNLFLESCHRIQMDETQLETKISLVLEKLLDSLSNRSLVSFKELQSTEEIIKIQSNNMERLINQNTNTIMKLSEKTSEDRKKIEKILSTAKKDFANFKTTIEHEINFESLERSDKLDNIGNLILELQAQVNDLDSKMNKDNMNYNAKQMLHEDVLQQQTKDIFAEQLNISTINKVNDFVKDIYQLLYNINIKINRYVDEQSHLHKLNVSQINYNVETVKPHENVDIVFGESDKSFAEPNGDDLFRYNYSFIDDNEDNNKNIVNVYTIPEPTTINDNDEIKKKMNILPEASTVSSKIVTENPTITNENSDELLLFSSEENSDFNSDEFSNKNKDENNSLEKPITEISYEENKFNSTNNIISTDNNIENLYSEEVFATTTIINIPPSDSEDKSNESGGVDILEELFTKFFGNMQQNDYMDSITTTTTTTDTVDNTDYDDNFYD